MWSDFSIKPYPSNLVLSRIGESFCSYRGVVAEKQISFGERIVAVPLNHLITVNEGEANELNEPIAGISTALLAWKLLKSVNKEGTFWAEYRKFLPESVKVEQISFSVFLF